MALLWSLLLVGLVGAFVVYGLRRRRTGFVVFLNGPREGERKRREALRLVHERQVVLLEGEDEIPVAVRGPG